MYFNLYSLPGLISFIASLLIGLTVYLKNPKNSKNQLFLVFTFFISCFCLGEALLRSSNTIYEGLLWGRISYIGVIFVPMTLLHLSYLFTTDKERKNSKITKYLLVLLYIISFGLMVIFNVTLSSSAVSLSSFGYRLKLDPSLFYIGLWNLLIVLYATYNFINIFYKTNSAVKRKQIKYISYGSVISIIFIAPSNVILPIMGINIFPMASLVIPIFCFFVGISILKYDLFIYIPMRKTLLDKNELLSLNSDELKKEVTARTQALLKSNEELKKSLAEKEILLKEVHHRVKNNLQIISSLLKLQSESIDDEMILEKFKESMNRVKSMALIHDKIFCSGNLEKINFDEYLTNFLGTLFRSYQVSINTISLDISADNIFLDVDTAISCGLIVNELVSNSLKHGFPEGKSGKISINMMATKEEYTLIVDDTGIGLPKDVDIKNPDSLGLQLVHMLVQQLEGSINFEDSNGLKVIILFAKSNEEVDQKA